MACTFCLRLPSQSSSGSTSLCHLSLHRSRKLCLHDLWCRRILLFHLDHFHLSKGACLLYLFSCPSQVWHQTLRVLGRLLHLLLLPPLRGLCHRDPSLLYRPSYLLCLFCHRARCSMMIGRRCEPRKCPCFQEFLYISTSTIHLQKQTSSCFPYLYCTYCRDHDHQLHFYCTLHFGPHP